MMNKAFFLGALLVVGAMLRGESNAGQPSFADTATQLRAELGFFQNPYALAFTVAEANQVYGRLSAHEIYAEVQQRIVDSAKSGQILYLRDFDDIAARIRSLRSGNISRDDRQAYLAAIENILQSVAETASGAETLPGGQSKTQQPKKGKPKFAKSYQPHTKQLSEEQNEQQKKKVYQSVQGRVPLWGKVIYGLIIRHHPSPFQSVTLPIHGDLQHRVEKGSTVDVTLHTELGEKDHEFFVPTGMWPVRTDSATQAYDLVEDGSGDFSVSLRGSEQPTVAVTVTKLKKRKLTELEIDFYTRAVGFADSDWPEPVQDLVQRLRQGQRSPRHIASTLSEHIASAYKYSDDEKPETDPAEALRAGSFQCDMAAYALVGLLRDSFHLPARVVAGYRGKRKAGDAENSYLLLPETGHAWVEAFVDDEWVAFDPTPRTKEKQEQEKNKQDEDADSKQDDDSFSDIGDGESKPEDGGKESGDGKSQKSGDGSGKGKGKVPHDGKGKDDGKSSKAKKAGGNRNNHGADHIEPEDEAQAQRLGQELQRLKPAEAMAHLLNFAQEILAEAIHPERSAAEVRVRLAKLGKILTLLKRDFKFDPMAVEKAIEQAVEVHQEAHEPMLHWLGGASALARSGETSALFRECSRMISVLELYQQYAVTSASGQYAPMIALLKRVREVLQTLALPSSFELAVVHSLMQSLSPLARKMLRRRYGFEQIGNNEPTLRMYRDLHDGKLTDIRLMALQHPRSDFALHSELKIPTGIRVKTLLRDAGPGHDVLSLNQLADFSRAFYPEPGLGIEESLFQGKAYVFGQRFQTWLPIDSEEVEAEKITIVGYDLSGSMGGNPEVFQAGLIAAFVGRALSEENRAGLPAHKVILIPFDHEVGDPKTIATREDAISFLDDYRVKLGRAAGGTDIEKFMLAALKLIAVAQREKKNPLRFANIVVMTDGYAPVNYDVLHAARKEIDRKTSVQAVFVAIGGSNDELARFAADSEKAGFDRGFYREYSWNDVELTLHNSRNLPGVQGDARFFFPENSPTLPKEALTLLSEAGELAAAAVGQRKAKVNADRQMILSLSAELARRRYYEEEIKMRPLSARLELTDRAIAAIKNDLDTETLLRIASAIAQWAQNTFGAPSQWSLAEVSAMRQLLLKTGVVQ